jgi:(E)-4-hydroxy-3-methylbut-2-enyl-diphosphate synthase
VTQHRSSVVDIGGVPLGGDYPVRLQSMTNTRTGDTAASVAQCIRIAEAGADYIRLTARDNTEAENLANIKRELRQAGFNTPLIADIHFNPSVAITAARLVEKVRINPGNYADKRATFRPTDLTDAEYRGELERIHTRLLPLITECQRHGTAIRVGVNHGSLSDRIMSRHGNTPLGMAISAMEFIEIFAAENFQRLVISMKSSNILVMIESTRLLVEQMRAAGHSLPLHLGVTEAGEGEDGRIRSALGIGALLTGGIGDTIRVSLSEPPEAEIPVARMIADRAAMLLSGGALTSSSFTTIGGTKTLRLRYNIADHDELAIKASVDASLWLPGSDFTDLVIDNGTALPDNAVRSVEAGLPFFA